MKLKKIAVIIPYFGRFNNYFPIWLHSCKYNPTIDWLIFTDDKALYVYPKNVIVRYTTFEETRERIQAKFDFEIFLDRPYKLCEFRPAFGEVYEEYLHGYDFWGWGDTDLIWGNLRRHLTDEILSTCSKISTRGHFTLIKNDKANSRAYRNEVNGVALYRYVFTNDTSIHFYFDEHEITYIFERTDGPIYRALPFADLEVRSFNFKKWYYDEPEPHKNVRQVFYWNNGELYRLYVHEGKLTAENYAYVHFLKRPMAIDGQFDPSKNIWIVPNKFISDNKTPEVRDVLRFSAQRFYWGKVMERFTIRYLVWKYENDKDQKEFNRRFKRVRDQPMVVLQAENGRS